jgi:plasmid stabilization system protein ParE
MNLDAHPEAEEEFLEAIATQTREQGPAAALELIDAVEGVYDSLRRGTAFSNVAPHVPPELGARRVLVQGHIYQVIFIPRPTFLAVVAVAHLARKSGYWIPRVKHYPTTP